MIVNVTQKHIDEAKKIRIGRPARLCCPIALAINDLLKPAFHSSVVGPYFTINVDTVEHEFIRCHGDVIVQLRTFIQAFDRCDEVKPTSFDLKVPSKFLK